MGSALTRNASMPNLTNSQAEHLAKLKIAERCKEDLLYLCRYILGYDKVNPVTHGKLTDYTKSILPNRPPLEKTDEFDPEKNFLLLLMPRGSFKSTVVTIGFTLQMILNDPDVRILIDSETFSKSKAFFLEAKAHLEGNEKFREIYKTLHGVYPDANKKHGLWTDSQLNVGGRRRERKEPTLSCSGVEKTVTGMHYDLIIMDDVVSDTNIGTKDQLEKVKTHFKLALSLLDPNRPMIVIGTRWHFDDLYQHLLDFERDRFNVLVQSAYNEDGSLFFPEVLSEDFLEKTKRSQGSAIFAAQYLNNPIDDEDAPFKREYLIHKSWDEVKNIPINWYLSVDPSYEGPFSDNAGFVVAGMDYQRNLYVKHILRKKVSYGEIINQIFDIFTNSNVKIQRILVETIATQKSLGIELTNEQKRRNTWLPIQEIRSRQTAKEERIKGLQPFYEFGHVIHIKEAPQLDELEYELLHFPRTTRDDVVDAFASILEVASPPTIRNTDPEERARKRVSFKPRSPVTGV